MHAQAQAEREAARQRQQEEREQQQRARVMQPVQARGFLAEVAENIRQVDAAEDAGGTEAAGAADATDLLPEEVSEINWSNIPIFRGCPGPHRTASGFILTDLLRIAVKASSGDSQVASTTRKEQPLRHISPVSL